jgi:tripartite-type tricarboxylate transporter receptor subunit TctC
MAARGAWSASICRAPYEADQFRQILKRQKETSMTLIPRTLAGMLLALCALSGASASAADYPDHPIHLIVPFAPGGASDQTARYVAQKLTDRMGQPVIVENRTGAAGVIGESYVARSAADGYTLMLIDTSFSMVVGIGTATPFDPLKDFTHLRLIVTTPAVVAVNPKVPAHTLKELLDIARASPGKVTYGSGGIGSPLHLAAALLADQSGTQMLHVPYKGAAPAVMDTIAGQVQLSIPALPAALPYLKSGQLRALAVTSSHRAALLPDVPTVSEAGVPGYEATSWFGLSLPANVPAPIVKKLRGELDAVLAQPETIAFFASQGADVDTAGRPFPDFIKHEIAKWTELARKADIHP